MGPWGIGTFEDEIACDWLEDLHDSDPVAFLWHCLALTGLGYLEHLAGIGVICSAEIIHGLCDHPRPGLPEAAFQWLRSHRQIDATALLPQAISGMRRVLGPDSELWERWQDHDEWRDQWWRHAADLLERLEHDLKAIQKASSRDSDRRGD